MYGDDELVLSLLDPDTGDPMLEGVNGYGDVVRMTELGIELSDEVTTGGPYTGGDGVGIDRRRPG
jgi:hypothetical protein